MSQPSKVRKLAKMVMETTGGGRSLIEFLFRVHDGQVEDATMKDRLEATKLLLERGFGKAPVQIEVTGQVTHVMGKVDVSKLSNDELDMLRKTLRRAVVNELPAVVESSIEDAEIEEPS